MKRTRTATSVLYVSLAGVLKIKAQIDGNLADAVAALNLAAAKLGAAIDEYEPADHANGCLEKADLLEARYTARFFADMLETSDAPITIPSRVFQAIAKFANDQDANTPHIEGAILALLLAERSLTAALECAGQDEDEITERYQQPYAALGTLRQYLAMLTSAAFVFDEKEALDAILTTPRTRALAA